MFNVAVIVVFWEGIITLVVWIGYVVCAVWVVVWVGWVFNTLNSWVIAIGV